VVLSRRHAHAAAAGVAAAATWLAAAEIGSHRRVRLTGLWVISCAAMAGMAAGLPRSSASASAKAAHARLDSFFNNGGSVGGDFHVNGDHYITGTLHGASGSLPVDSGSKLKAAGGLSISSYTLTMNHGDPTAQGGAPGSYTPSYESALAAVDQSIITGVSNSGVFA
jgi:hypothetical protein